MMGKGAGWPGYSLTQRVNSPFSAIQSFCAPCAFLRLTIAGFRINIGAAIATTISIHFSAMNFSAVKTRRDFLGKLSDSDGSKICRRKIFRRINLKPAME